MDSENFIEYYYTNLKDMKNKEKDTNKEKIFMLEILQDLLLDKDKVEYENFNKRILELTIKDKEITEEINVFDNILKQIQFIKTHSKPAKDGKKKTKF
jgi:hypothetical protein